MKTRLFRLALLALPLLAAAPRATAAFNPALVAADAQWVVYADLNALRETAMGKELLTLATKFQFDTGSGKVGLDWQKLLATIGTATAYGTNFSPDAKQLDGALIVQGTADLRKIAESLLIQANLANPHEVLELTDLPFPAYGLAAAKAKAPAAKDAKDPKDTAAGAATAAKPAAPDVIIAFPPEPIVLVSKSKAQLVKARDVFRGAAPSLAKSASPLSKFTKNADGAYLFTAGIVPGDQLLPGDGPQTRIIKMTTAGSGALGERGVDTFARAELTAANDQSADKLMKILQGMTAMLSLAETSDKQLAEFLNSAQVTRDGKNVSVHVAYSSARLAQMIKSLEQTQSQSRSAERAPAAPIVSGKALAQWKAEAAPAGTPLQVVTRTIEHVALHNGAMISLGRATNGGKAVKFDRLEISSPAGGPAMIFRSEFMRAGGPRGNLQQIQFPGADGDYTIKVSYQNDPDGKADYAVSVRNPPPAGAPAAVPVSETPLRQIAPAPKTK